MVTQQTKLTIDGATMHLDRLAERDTSSHQYWRFYLVLADGTRLFGKRNDTIGLSRYVNHPSKGALYTAFFCATLTEVAVDWSFFKEHTADELTWIASTECEQLGCRVSQIEERAIAQVR